MHNIFRRWIIFHNSLLFILLFILIHNIFRRLIIFHNSLLLSRSLSRNVDLFCCGNLSTPASSVAKRRQRFGGGLLINASEMVAQAIGYPTRDFSLAIALLHSISLLSRTRKSFLASRQQPNASPYESNRWMADGCGFKNWSKNVCSDGWRMYDAFVMRLRIK